MLQQVKDLLDEEQAPPLFIFVNKGIESGTQALTLEIVADTCGIDIAKTATFLSGPSFAKESEFVHSSSEEILTGAQKS